MMLDFLDTRISTLPSFPLNRKSFLCSAAGIIIFLLLVLFLLTIFFPVDSRDSSPVEFTVEKGQGNWNIATRLQDQNLIRSRGAFTLYAFFTGRSFSLQSGEYLLHPSMNAHAIIQTISTGDTVKEAITIQEGWDLKDIAEEFEKRGLSTKEELYDITGYPGADHRENIDLPKGKDFSNEFEFLESKPDYVSLEGYLFPDTYQITAQENPENFIRRMLKNFEGKITEDILTATEAQGKTLFEVLTMASIIEKEVRSLEDKKIVSGILWKRIAHGMRLQVDATIVYVREGNYYKVTFDELETKSSYNTYDNEGLPPGPIANPGIESMHAALEPEESPYWFYLSPSANKTIFSRTFEEHKAAAQLYIR
jgi:UPF0755 protein